MANTFNEVDIQFMRDCLVANEITIQGKDTLEAMWRRIDHHYNLCRSCPDAISHSFKKLRELIEMELGHSILDVQAIEEPQLDERLTYTQTELKSLTAREIVILVHQTTDTFIDINIKYKTRIIKEALKLLNN